MHSEARAARMARNALSRRALSADASGRPACRQRGQALLLGMFLLVMVAMFTFFMFSAGQLGIAKRRLVNATDAAAYSVGLWQARTMNYQAYANRAIIANEVMIAQTVTMVSYMKYMQVLVDRAEDVGRYIPPLAAFFRGLEQVVDMANTLTRYVARVEVVGRSAYMTALAASQQGMHALGNNFIGSALSNEVGWQTDRNFFIHVLGNSWLGNERMVKLYKGDERQRLKGLIVESLDPYSKGRRTEHWPGKSAGIPYMSGPKLVRVGQTQMIRDHDTHAFDRWQAHDSVSLHMPRGWFSRRTRERVALGWGGAEVATSTKDELDRLNRQADGMKRTNGKAYRQISQSDFFSSNGYFGLPVTTELDYDSQALKDNPHFPTLRIGVVGYMKDDASAPEGKGNRRRIGTADQIGLGAGKLQLQDRLPRQHNGVMSALSAAEIYFRRPPGKDKRLEYASLYSPYWQARLAPVPQAWRLAPVPMPDLGKE